MTQTEVRDRVPAATNGRTIGAMQFAVLGALEVTGDAGPVPLGSPKQRRVLAVLISRFGEPVTVDALLEAVWDGPPPRSAAKTLQGYVVHLRQALAGAELAQDRSCAIVTTAAGYRLDVAADDAVDSVRFASLLARARNAVSHAEWASARVFAEEALSLWRGPAYAEFANAAFAESETARLEELRLVALETQFEIDLALGEDAALIPALEKALAAQPTRERLWELLIRALYRAGRQSDALLAYVRARDLLATELGVEPGPGLRGVHSAVLSQDAGLDRGADIPLRDAYSRIQLTTGAYAFDGRDHDLAWLRAQWLCTVECGCRIAVISGVSGIGKTRLLGVFADEVERSAGVVVRRTAAAAPSPAAIAALADGSPVLVVLDDPLTGLDPAAFALCRVLVVVGVDKDQVPPHVLDSLQRAEWRELEPLPRVVCARIAARWVEDASGELDTGALIEAAEGNPGRLHQLLARAVDDWSRQRVDRSVRELPAARAGVTALRAELATGVRGLRRRRHGVPPACDDRRRQPPACPYRGLQTYGVDDAMVFCGRDRLIEALVARVADCHVVTVVGGSGSGKSSLVRAGLLAALAGGCLPGSAGWQQFIVNAGDELPNPGVSPAVIVIDQFEQAWVADDEAARLRYLDALLALADAGHRLVLTVRADHVDRCMEHPRLREAIPDGAILVGPMSTSELTEVVVGPAQAVGRDVESALVSRILDDVRGLATPLPLLSTALARTWVGDVGSNLTLQTYLNRGGVAGSVAQWAEAAYTALTPAEQAAARQLFLRLATGERGMLVRRHCTYAEAATDQVARNALDALAAARLITVDDTGVEVVHEALFDNWPRLAAWLDEDEQGRRLRDHLTPSALDWDRNGRPESDLYRGVRLDAATEWADQHPSDLNPTEHAFLTASVARAHQELHTERRRRRRLRALLIAAGTAAVLAATGAAVAVAQRNNADRQGRHALAGQLGAAALVDQPIDRSLLLAASAVAIQNNVDTRGDLLTALQRSPAAESIWHGDGSRLYGVVLADHGHIVAATGENGVTTWNLTSRTPTHLQEFCNDYIPVLAPRPGSPEVAVADTPGSNEPGPIVFWNFAEDEQSAPPLFGAKSRIASLAWSTNGRWLAAAQDPGNLMIWDATREGLPALHVNLPSAHSSPGGRFPAVVAAGADRFAVVEQSGQGFITAVHAHSPSQTFRLGPNLSAVASNPAATVLAVGRMNGAVGFFDIRTGRPLRSLVSHSSAVDAIAFSADGRRVASVGSDGAVNVSDAATGQLLLRLTGHLAPVTGAAFSTDDRTLYTSSTDGTIIGWNLANPNNLGTQLSAEGTGAFSWVAVSPTGEIATEYRNGTVRFWAADSTSPTPPIPVANSALDGGSFSPNGRLFATAEKSGASHLVDVATRRVIGVLAQIPGGAHGAQFSPDGRTIALGDDSDKVYLINVASRQQIGTPLVADHPGELVWSPDSRRLAVQIGPTGDLTVYNLTSKAAAWQHPAVSSGVAWSPDGKTIATGGSSADGTQLWSAADGAPTGGGWQDHPITDDLAYSPDGSLLASAGLDGTVVLRDAATGDQFGPPLIADSSQQDHVWVDFDRADDLIVATSGGSLQRWHVNNLRYLLRQACTIAGRNLTRTEWNDLHTSHAYVRACR